MRSNNSKKKNKKSILLSLLVIGVVATMITAATTAQFTDQVTSVSNTFSNAVVKLSVDGECGARTTGSGGDGGVNAAGDDGCSLSSPAITGSDLLPGESDSHTFEVENAGTRSGDLEVSFANVTSSVTECAVTNWDLSATPSSSAELAAGSTVDIEVTAELLSSAGNACQDAELTFDVVFDFVQNGA